MYLLRHQPISTHTPHAGRNKCREVAGQFFGKFQLTRPMRGATAEIIIDDKYHYSNFNSHAPCGAQLLLLPLGKGTIQSLFQLTRPMRGATWNALTNTELFLFQLTRPMRGATNAPRSSLFSIHSYFNSHAPCGAQLAHIQPLLLCLAFQLTRPMRGATVIVDVPYNPEFDFNSHAPCGAQH